MQPFEYPSVRSWSKEINGTHTGGRKTYFLIRGRRAAHGHGGRASGILSIPAKQVSRGAHRVGTIHVQAPTPHTPPLQAFLVDFSQQPTPLWQPVSQILSLIRECRRAAVWSGKHEGIFLGRYCEFFGRGGRI